METRWRRKIRGGPRSDRAARSLDKSRIKMRKIRENDGESTFHGRPPCAEDIAAPFFNSKSNGLGAHPTNGGAAILDRSARAIFPPTVPSLGAIPLVPSLIVGPFRPMAIRFRRE